MEQNKILKFVKASSCIRKMVKESSPLIASIQVITTVIFALSIAFFVVVLGMFINNRVRKIIVSEEYYFETTQRMPPSIVEQSNHRFRDFSDWIAPKELWHSMSDDELMWRASMVPQVKEYPYDRTPKVAFMFLTRKMLPLAPLWEIFFKGHEGLYSIYIHSSSESIDEPLSSSVFYKRRIPSKAAEWGRATIVDAERRLLANALLDFSNQRFILLSESCIPLFNFTTIYNYLIINNKHNNFVGSFDDPRNIGRGRYNKKMAPTILLSDWRKGSQWFEVQRELAISIISDVIFYPLFRDHCKSPCYMDEHYLATLVAKIKISKGLINSNRSITWVDWSKSGSHPTTFVRKDVSEEFLNRIKGLKADCLHDYNIMMSSSSICYLFARKFHPSTLEPLLRIAHVLFGFNP